MNLQDSLRKNTYQIFFSQWRVEQANGTSVSTVGKTVLTGRSNNNDGCALTVCFGWKLKKWEEKVRFYRKSARKTKRRFDSRERPIKERHVSCAINASGQSVRRLYTWPPLHLQPLTLYYCHRHPAIHAVNSLLLLPSARPFELSAPRLWTDSP